jgi:threonine dehydratase
VLVPIGGGGLIGGIAQALKLFKPEVRVIGVEAAGSPKMVVSREEGKPAVLDGIYTIADGLASKVAVPEVFEVVDNVVDEIVTVSDEEMLDAIRFLLQRAKLLTETAGAATTAALLTGKVSLKEGTRTVAVISGGNYDVEGYLRLTKEPKG